MKLSTWLINYLLPDDYICLQVFDKDLDGYCFQ